MSLSIQHLNLSHDQQAILTDFSCEIHTGEFVAILGASGSGKSSLLQAICGLLPIQSGQILVDGQDLTHLPPHQRPITMVFQDLRLFPHMSVFENIAFPLKMAKVPQAAWAQIVSDVLADVQLSGFETRKIHQLSGGQQQRIALARALASNPQLLLLDEPFSGLDEPLRHEMGQLIQQLHQSKQMTILFVTHDRQEAIQYANRIAFIHQQSLAQFDQASALIERPVHPYIAQYFGNYNLLPGKVVSGQFLSDHLEWPLLSNLADGCYTAMIRSNQIQFTPTTANHLMSLTGTIRQIIPGDYQQTIYFTSPHASQTWEINVALNQHFIQNQVLTIYLDPASIWLIPHNTKEAHPVA